jgi:transposase, IS5 family
VTADRGYGQPVVERDLHALGVRTVAIPRQGPVPPARKTTEHSRGFRRLVKWRTGSEGRISYLKHVYGWDRTRLDGKAGAAIWCGHGVFAHNLVKIGSSARDRDQAQAHGVTARIPPSAQAPAQAFFRSK